LYIGIAFMETIFVLVILFFSIVIHEIAHGSAALSLGDPTAKNEGRLTLNPLKHIDIFGTILLPLILLLATKGRGPIFGWAKPVPINPYNFRDQKWGVLKVAIAGPAMNFLIALIFGLAIRFISLPQSLLIFFSIIAVYNFAWGIFNLVPIPPLDGSHILFTLLSEKFSNLKFFIQQYSLFLLIFFIFFGLNWIFLAAEFLYLLVSGQPLVI
jgi:Zn-dependent protease